MTYLMHYHRASSSGRIECATLAAAVELLAVVRACGYGAELSAGGLSLFAVKSDLRVSEYIEDCRGGALHGHLDNGTSEYAGELCSPCAASRLASVA
jgi:hypothetical protein